MFDQKSRCATHVAARVLSCKYLHNDFIQNIFLFHSRNCQKYYQCKETVMTSEKKSIRHLKNGAKSALGERDLVGCWKRKEHEQKQYV